MNETDRVMEIMSECGWITASMTDWGLRKGIPVWEGPDAFEAKTDRSSVPVHDPRIKAN